MSRLQQLEVKLAMRRIKAVLEWYDPEECDIPWSYVERTGDGRFELFTTLYIEDAENGDHADPISLGYVTSPADARRVLANYDRWDIACERMRKER